MKKLCLCICYLFILLLIKIPEDTFSSKHVLDGSDPEHPGVFHPRTPLPALRTPEILRDGASPGE